MLCIDGGGIRGLLPAMVLAALEEHMRARGDDRPLHQRFDLIVGTSTGGIIAAGLVAPSPKDRRRPAMDAARLVDLYDRRGPEIFARERFRNLREALGRFSGRPLSQEKYDADPLERILGEYLGRAQMRDALTNVVLPAYDIEHRGTLYMRGRRDINRLNADKNGAHDFYFKDAARATSAAPTFFEPVRVRNLDNGDLYTLVDGGVFANQPTLCALAQAKALGWALDDVKVLSLGTGYQTRQYTYEQTKDWGPLQWINPNQATPILSIVMHGQADSSDWNAEQFLGKAHFTRIDAELERGKGMDDMDDASRRNLDNLAELAGEMIAGAARDLEEWAR
ncbi:MAG: patatin-like phospholipase family protein [Pseudomonadota bacterium]